MRKRLRSKDNYDLILVSNLIHYISTEQSKDGNNQGRGLSFAKLINSG